MKIAHIAPPWISVPPKNYGGTENVLYNLIEEQVAQGDDVTLVAPGDANTSASLVSFFQQSLIESGIPWPAHLKAYYHLHKAIEYVQKHDFDILHTHLSCASDMYLFPLTQHLPTPHVMTLHSRFPFDRVESWMGKADELYMEWAKSVPIIAISERLRDTLPHPLHIIDVVHNGISMEPFCSTTVRPESFFAWLGRIIPEKGTHLAIEAAKKAGVPLILAGTVDRHLPEAVSYFTEVIQPQIDGQQIKYIGPVNLAQKIDLFSRARALLNPIQWEEPFGMVMIEAMAAGCPVITFPYGACSEIVAHQRSGFLVQNITEMVQAIASIDELDRTVVRTHVEQNFSAQVMAERYKSAYKKVIASVASSAHSHGGVGERVPVLVAARAAVRTACPVPVVYSSARLPRGEEAEVEPPSW